MNTKLFENYNQYLNEDTNTDDLTNFVVNGLIKIIDLHYSEFLIQAKIYNNKILLTFSTLNEYSITISDNTSLDNIIESIKSILKPYGIEYTEDEYKDDNENFKVLRCFIGKPTELTQGEQLSKVCIYYYTNIGNNLIKSIKQIDTSNVISYLITTDNQELLIKSSDIQ